MIAALRRWWLDRRIHGLSLQLAATREDLDSAEEDLLRQLPQEILCDIQSDVVDLRAREAILMDALVEAHSLRAAIG